MEVSERVWRDEKKWWKRGRRKDDGGYGYGEVGVRSGGMT